MGFGDQASSRRVRPDPRSEKAGTNPLCPWFQFQIRDTVALHAMSSISWIRTGWIASSWLAGVPVFSTASAPSSQYVWTRDLIRRIPGVISGLLRVAATLDSPQDLWNEAFIVFINFNGDSWISRPGLQNLETACGDGFTLGIAGSAFARVSAYSIPMLHLQ